MSYPVTAATEGYEVGQHVGDYEILDILGSGGMGRVYKLRNVISQRVEAMKVLLADLEAQQELMSRFLREIRVVGTLRHPHIAGLLTAQRHGDRILMMMDFVEGQPLDQVMQARRMAVSEAVRYSGQILDALDYAHKKGVIHRDIKPQNILITPGGEAVLADFGIAIASQDVRLTQVGRTLGSLHYMSPEQVQGAGQVDGRSDVYSMGIMLYELVTGRRPITGSTDFAVISAHVHYVPPAPAEFAPGIPAMLSDCVMKAIAKDPAARFQSAGAMRASLEAAVRAGANVEVTPDPLPPAGQQAGTVRPVKPSTVRDGTSGWRRLIYVLAGSVAALILAVAAIRLSGSGATAPPAERTGLAQSRVPEAPPAPPPPSDLGSSQPAVPSSPVLPASSKGQPRSTERPHASVASSRIKPVPSPRPPLAPASEKAVRIESEPSGASLSVDDGLRTCNSPCSVSLTPGRHTIKAGLAGFRDALRFVTTPQESQVFLYLTPQIGTLAVRSQPDDALIFIDGKRHGQNTPALLLLPIGKYKIEFRKQGFSNYSEEIEVRDQITRVIEVLWR